MAIKVTNDALQMFGARGYSRDYPMERMARDARMFTIGGGTAQVLRNFIAGAGAGLEAAADPGWVCGAGPDRMNVGEKTSRLALTARSHISCCMFCN